MPEVTEAMVEAAKRAVPIMSGDYGITSEDARAIYTAMRALEPRASSDGVVGRLIAKCLSARANGDPAKYLAGLTVADAYAIAAALQSQPSSNEARLREALEPFARYARLNDLDERDPDDAIEVPVRDLLAARAALLVDERTWPPNLTYVQACRDQLDMPEWQPNRAVWADLCDVALTALRPVEADDAGLIERVARAIYESMFVDEWVGGQSAEAAQLRQCAAAAIEACGLASLSAAKVEAEKEVERLLEKLRIKIVPGDKVVLEDEAALKGRAQGDGE